MLRLLLNPPIGNFMTWKVRLESTLSSASIWLCTTETPVMTEMMAATPAMMPTRVRIERSLWAPIAEMAIL